MNKYRNTITGTEIIVDSVLGGNWVLVENTKPTHQETKKDDKPVKKEKKKK